MPAGVWRKEETENKMEYAHQYDDKGRQPWVVDIEKTTLENSNFRTTLWTGKKLQLTVMSIPVGGEIGLEQHHGIDQFLRIEQGKGLCQMGDAADSLTFEKEVKDDDAILVPADKWHNVKNIGDVPLRLYTLYADPDHVAGTVHPTAKDAELDPNEE